MNGSVEYIKEKSQKIELTDKRTALTFLERENDTLQSLSFEWMKFFFFFLCNFEMDAQKRYLQHCCYFKSFFTVVFFVSMHQIKWWLSKGVAWVFKFKRLGVIESFFFKVKLLRLKSFFGINGVLKKDGALHKE